MNEKPKYKNEGMKPFEVPSNNFRPFHEIRREEKRKHKLGKMKIRCTVPQRDLEGNIVEC